MLEREDLVEFAIVVKLMDGKRENGRHPGVTKEVATQAKITMTAKVKIILTAMFLLVTEHGVTKGK